MRSGRPLCAAEEVAEKCDILIPSGATDLLHAPMVALQQALCSRDPQLLQVQQWAVSGSVLKAANEVAKAHARVPGEGLERKAFVKVLVQPVLRAGDAVVIVLGF